MSNKKKILTFNLTGLQRLYILRAIHGLAPLSSDESWTRYKTREDLLGKDWDWSDLRVKGKISDEETKAITALDFSPETARAVADIVDRLAGGEKVPGPMGLAAIPFDELAEILPLGRRMRDVADGKADDDTRPAIALADSGR